VVAAYLKEGSLHFRCCSSNEQTLRPADEKRAEYINGMSLTFRQATAQLTEPGSRFEMTEEIVLGRPTRVWKNAPLNLASVFESSAVFADRTYLVYEDESYTYSQIHQQVYALAHALSAVGVNKGDRVAFALRNYPEWVTIFWAALTVGAIAVPLNAWWTGPELRYGIEDSGARVIFVDQERADRLSDHLPTLRRSHAPLLVVNVRSNSVPQSEGYRDFDSVSFEDLIASAQGESYNAVSLDPDDSAAIFYTSGTTGQPKGALISHRNIVSCLMNAFFSSSRSTLMRGSSPDQSREPARQPAPLLSVPLFHATGCFATLIPNTVVGGKIVLMYRWNPEKALELIERESITSFGGVPTMVWQVLNSPSFEASDVSSVQNVGYGGAPSAPELVRRIRQHFPTSLPTNGYGLTETSAIATLNVGENYAAKPDSVGPPLPVIDLKVVDQEGKELESYQTGELWIQGPTVIQGYWNKPEATAASFTDGWFHTGDIAYLDDDGYVYIVDRAKDMVIRGGENVYSIEVESAIFEHPGIADVAVIGIPDLVLGEEVAAIIQRRPHTSVSADELRHHLEERIAGFKVPRYIYFLEEPLPRNAAGKVLKRKLKETIIESEIENPSR
jgi:long-chain acyl-CoA synthetase